MSRGGTTLYVTGFGHGTRARDLAYEFERYVFSRVSMPSPSPRTISANYAPAMRQPCATAPFLSPLCFFHPVTCALSAELGTISPLDLTSPVYLTPIIATVVSSVATFLHLVLPLADCKLPLPTLMTSWPCTQ